MRGLAVIILLLVEGSPARRVRLKRQVLPSRNVDVHSLHSYVTEEEGRFNVTSEQSRIDLNERLLNASVWSSDSQLIFDLYDTYVNYTASNADEYYVISGATLFTRSKSSQFSVSTNRTTNNHSRFLKVLSGDVSLRLHDHSMGIEAVKGTAANVIGRTWEVNETRRMNLLSENSQGARVLVVTAIAPVYYVSVVLSSAEVQLEYGNAVLNIDPSYRHLMIYTPDRNISLSTATSAFEVSMDERQLQINCKDEFTTAVLYPNSSDILLNVGQYSMLEIDRNGASFQPGVLFGESLNLTSMGLELNLTDGQIVAISNRSRIDTFGNVTNVGLTAALHNLILHGGGPRLLLNTGNVTVEMRSVANRTVLPTILPPFQPPTDAFAHVGPNENETATSLPSGTLPPYSGTEEQPIGDVTDQSGNDQAGMYTHGHQGMPNVGGSTSSPHAGFVTGLSTNTAVTPSHNTVSGNISEHPEEAASHATTVSESTAQAENAQEDIVSEHFPGHTTQSISNEYTEEQEQPEPGSVGITAGENTQPSSEETIGMSNYTRPTTVSGLYSSTTAPNSQSSVTNPDYSTALLSTFSTPSSPPTPNESPNFPEPSPLSLDTDAATSSTDFFPSPLPLSTEPSTSTSSIIRTTNQPIVVSSQSQYSTDVHDELGTTSDNFVIGQFGSTDFAGGTIRPHTVPQDDLSYSHPLSLFATISSIDMYTEPTMFPTLSPGDTPFPRPEALSRRIRSANDALVMRLSVPDSVNVHDEKFQSSLKSDLVHTVHESLASLERAKRNVPRQEEELIQVTVSQIDRDGHAISVQFAVSDADSQLHTILAKAMEELGKEKLSKSMHYPVVEVTHIILQSSPLWFALSVTSVFFLIFITLISVWKLCPATIGSRVADRLKLAIPIR